MSAPSAAPDLPRAPTVIRRDVPADDDDEGDSGYVVGAPPPRFPSMTDVAPVSSSAPAPPRLSSMMDLPPVDRRASSGSSAPPPPRFPSMTDVAEDDWDEAAQIGEEEEVGSDSGSRSGTLSGRDDWNEAAQIGEEKEVGSGSRSRSGTLSGSEVEEGDGLEDGDSLEDCDSLEEGDGLEPPSVATHEPMSGFSLTPVSNAQSVWERPERATVEHGASAASAGEESESVASQPKSVAPVSLAPSSIALQPSSIIPVTPASQIQSMWERPLAARRQSSGASGETGVKEELGPNAGRRRSVQEAADMWERELTEDEVRGSKAKEVDAVFSGVVQERVPGWEKMASQDVHGKIADGVMSEGAVGGGWFSEIMGAVSSLISGKKKKFEGGEGAVDEAAQNAKEPVEFEARRASESGCANTEEAPTASTGPGALATAIEKIKGMVAKKEKKEKTPAEVRAEEEAKVNAGPGIVAKVTEKVKLLMAKKEKTPAESEAEAEAKAKAGPSAVANIIAKVKRMMAKKEKTEEELEAEARAKAEAKPALNKMKDAVCALPDPTLLFMTLIAAILFTHVIRPALLRTWAARLLVPLLLAPNVAATAMWRRTRVIWLKEGEELSAAAPFPNAPLLVAKGEKLRMREKVLKKAEGDLEKGENKLETQRREIEKRLATDDDSGGVDEGAEHIIVI